MHALRTMLTLITGDEPELPTEEEIAEARRELEEALEALLLARRAWSGAQTVDVEAVRRALENAERQLDRARGRLQRAEARAAKRDGD